MKANIIILAIILCVCFGYAYYLKSNDKPVFSNITSQQTDGTESKEFAPNFTYKTIDGKTGELNDHKDKVVLVHFWATWCAPCLVELPQIIELSQKLDKEVVVLAISSDTNKTHIERFMKKIKISVPTNFIIIEDPKKQITQDTFQTVRLPETYILSPDLSIYKKIIGVNENWTQKTLINDLKAFHQNAQ